MKPRSTNPFYAHLATFAAIFIVPLSYAADGTWNGISGNWTDSTDPLGVWSGGIIADGTGFNANFTGVDITADQSISLNGTDRTIGNITFTDASTSSHNLAITGNTLTLDVASGVPVIDVTQADRALSISSIVAGTDGLQKDGAGNLTLTAANTYTGTTTINAGTLQIGSGGATGSLSSAAIVNNANLVYNLDTNGTVLLLSSGLTGSGNLSATAGVIKFNGNITQGGALSFTQVGTAALFKGFELVAASTTLTGSSITLSGDVGKKDSDGNSLVLDTSASNGTINLDISLGRDNIWYIPSAFSANAGTGAINITGSGLNDTGWRNTPVTLTGAVNMTGNVNSSAAVTINATANGTVSGAFSGGMSLTKSGAGTLTLSAQNSFTGVLNINGGIVEFSNAGSAGSNVYGSTQININNAATLKVSGGAVGGNIEIFKGRNYTFDSGGGSSILLGTGNYNATTTAFGITTNGGARNNIGLITTSSANGFNLGSAVATFNVALGSDATSDLTITPIISNSGSIVKSGAGRLTFAGANTYSGATTISNGKLVIQNTSASATHSIASGATLELNYTSGSISSGNTTFSGAGTLSKTGAGSALWGGTAATFALGAGSLIDVQVGTFTGGSNANEVWTNNLSDLNVASGAIFDGVEANVRLNKITGTGTIKTGFGGAGYSVFTVGVDNGSSQFDGVIANSAATGNIAKAGSGTITLTNANTYTGTTTINGGTLVLSGAANSNSTSSIAIANSANLTFTATNSRSFTKAITGTAGDITFNVAGDTSDSGGGNGTNFTFNNTGAAFTGNIVINTGLVSPSSDAAFGDSANIIKLSAASGASSGLVATANLVINRSIELVTAGGNGIFRAYSGQTLTLGGVISGPGNFVKTDAGTVILNNANTFNGSTRVGFGPLHLGHSLALQNSTLQSAVTFLSSVGSNAFTLGGLSGSANQSLQNSASVAIALSVGNNNADTTYSGALSGAGSLVKIGTGVLTLSNTNTYTGATVVNAGTLIISGSIATVASNVGVNNAGILQFGNGGANGTAPSAGTIFVNNTGTVQLNKSDGGTLTNAIASNAGATTTLSGSNAAGTTNTFTATSFSNGSGGGFAIQSTNAGATLAFSGAAGAIDLKGTHLTVDGAGDTLFTGAGQGIYSSTTASNVTKSGTGTLIYQGNQGYTGTTAIDSGAIRVDLNQTHNGDYFVGNGGTTGTAGSLLLGGAGGTGGGVTFSNLIAINAGTANNRTLGGTNTTGTTNTFSGTTYSNGAGGLTVTSTNAGAILAFTNAQAIDIKDTNVLFNGAGNTNVSGAVYNSTGSGSVTKAGVGTLTLSASSTYTGATTVNAGTLVMGDAAADTFTTSGVTVNSTATLKGIGTVGGATTIQTGGIHNAGAHANNAPAPLAPVGAQAFSGNLTYSSQSIFAWDLGGEKDTATGTRGIDYDAVNVGGDLTAYVLDTDTDGGGPDTITPTPASDAIFRVIVGSSFDFTTVFWDDAREWSNIFNVTGTNSGWAAGTSVDVYNYDFANNTYTLNSPTAQGGFTINGSILTWTAVPEPSSALAGLLITAGLLRRRRA